MARVTRLFVLYICLAAAPAPGWAQQAEPGAVPAAPAAPAAPSAPAVQGAPAAEESTAAEGAPAAEGTVPMLPQFATGLDAADYTPWGMFLAADAVVKGVIVALILASLVTWTVLLAKTLELYLAARHQGRALIALGRARSLDDAARGLGKCAVAAALVQSAVAEIDLSAGALDDREGVKERVASRLERLETAAGRRIGIGIGLLATIGATAPFVGLFGTVWGIMNSFIGIAKTQTTNLAVVAPGIAEALLATALGLVAAIPAVVIYNVFARSITGYKAQVSDASAQVLLLVSRDLDHQGSERAAPHMVKVG